MTPKNTTLPELTLCMTMGNRPALLQQTLSSLLAVQQFEHVLAVNDFGDEASNDVFHGCFPQGRLVPHQAGQGHHQAVDALYAQVRTPYVMHIEDDWTFGREIPFAGIFEALDLHAQVSMVCVRDIADFMDGPASPSSAGVRPMALPPLQAYRLTELHEQWYGYTFNPHVTTIRRIRSVGAFSAFKKERHISRALRARGLYVAYLQDGGCQHIGDGHSVANVKSSPVDFLRRLWPQRP